MTEEKSQLDKVLDKVEEQALLVRIENPFTILGICTYLHDIEAYEIPNLYFWSELNIKGFIEFAKLNKWLYVYPSMKMAVISSGDDSYEKMTSRVTCHQLIFKTPEELISYLKII